MPKVAQRKAPKRSGSTNVGPSSKKSCPPNSVPELTLQEHHLTVDLLMKKNEELDRRVNSLVRETAGTSFREEHSYASKISQGKEHEYNSMDYNAINQRMLAKEPREPSQIILDLCKQAVNIEVATKIRNLMEAELICSICTEYFIKAATINCGHSFCADCLETWKKTKKECPICRTSISTTINSLIIDSCIEKVFEELGPEEQEKRKLIIDARIQRKKKKPAVRRRGRKRSRVAAMRRELPTVQSHPAARLPTVNLMQHPFFRVLF